MTGLEYLKSLEVFIRGLNIPEEDEDDQGARVQANISDAINELCSGLRGSKDGYMRGWANIIAKALNSLKVNVERDQTLLDNCLEYLSNLFNGFSDKHEVIVSDHLERLEVVINGSNAQLKRSMDATVKEHLKGLEASINDVLNDHLERLDANINDVSNVPLRATIEELLESLGVSFKDHVETLETRVKDISNDQLQRLETSVNRRGGESSDLMDSDPRILATISTDHLQRNTRVPKLTCGRRNRIPLEIRGLRTLENLTFLRLWNVAWSACIKDIGSLTNLEVLDLYGFQGDNLPDLSKLTNLRYLNIRECESFRSVDLRGLTKLEVLDVEFSDSVLEWDLSGCRSLRELWGVGRNDGDIGYKYFHLTPSTGQIALLFPLWLQDVPGVAMWKNVLTIKWQPVGDESSLGRVG